MSEKRVLATDNHEPATSAHELPGAFSQDIVHELRERFPFQLSRLRDTGRFHINRVVSKPWEDK